MSTILIQRRIKPYGVVADADELPTLSDPSSTFGIKRTDTNEVVVAAGTAMTHAGTGLYTYRFDGAVAGVTYAWSARYVVAGQTIYDPGSTTVPTSTGNVNSLPSYLTLDDYAALAAQIPALPFLAAATDGDRLAQFVRASREIDMAGPYQGRKYLADQDLEFPRIRDVTAVYPVPAYGALSADLTAQGIWDWDTTTNTAIVPTKVKLATLYQAEALKSGRLQLRRDRIAAGLTGQSTGSLSESYAAIQPGTLRPEDILCPEALPLMRYYRLRSGRLL